MVSDPRPNPLIDPLTVMLRTRTGCHLVFPDRRELYCSIGLSIFRPARSRLLTPSRRHWWRNTGLPPSCYLIPLVYIDGATTAMEHCVNPPPQLVSTAAPD